MMEMTANLPRVASRDEWLAERVELLKREKEFTRLRDQLSADRRRLPMVKIEKEYVFEGPEGEATLLELFDGRSQLMVGHFMFDPEWEDGCPSCSAGADEMSPGHLQHVNKRDTTFVYVSRAPIHKIEAYRARKGWTVPWYSSYGSDFNYDFDVTLDERVKPIVYNYRTAAEYERMGQGPFVKSTDGPSAERPGRSCFLRVGDDVFHTYSVYARGLESMGGSYYMLDETALGRQEDWEEPKGRSGAARGAIPDFAS